MGRHGREANSWICACGDGDGGVDRGCPRVLSGSSQMGDCGFPGGGQERWCSRQRGHEKQRPAGLKGWSTAGYWREVCV